jgi:hypothetical protein
MSRNSAAPVTYLAAASAKSHRGGAFVVIVRSKEELLRWSRRPERGVQWLQVEGLLRDADTWAMAAQYGSDLPLDVILTDPAREFSDLYRLADARIVRDVRVTMHVRPGFTKALRLATSLQLPVRLLPGQPSAEALAEMDAALGFYLHDPMAEAPVEFFHSLLMTLRGSRSVTLWTILEEDPGEFVRAGDRRPPDFVETQLAALIGQETECATCRWRTVCAGYFKWPDPAYSCAGVQRLFASIDSAADEIGRDLAAFPGATS